MRRQLSDSAFFFTFLLSPYFLFKGKRSGPIFPHSIGVEYIAKTERTDDIQLLSEITDKRTEERPLPTDLVIHLRIGNVIDFSYHTAEEYLVPNQTLTHKNNYRYVRNKLYGPSNYSPPSFSFLKGTHPIEYAYKKLFL